jgi:prepilin peptidase CpaA
VHSTALWPNSIAWWPTLLVLVVATFTDLRSRRIPNWLVLPFLLAGVAVAPFRGAIAFFFRGDPGFYGWHGVGQSLAGLTLGAAIYGFLFWMGGMGMGDVKLVAAVGAWIGPQQLLVALILTGLAGGAMALIWAGMGGFLGEIFKGAADLIAGIGKRGLRPHPELVLDNPLTRKMPYAPAIAIGTVASFVCALKAG